MEQVSTDKIKEKITNLEIEYANLREKEKRAYGYRDAGMDEYIGMGQRLFAIRVLRELIDE